MKSALAKKVLRAPMKVLQTPSILLEKLSDYCARRFQEIEHHESEISCISQEPIKGAFFELADIALSYLAHPFFGERRTKPKTYDFSWY